MPEKAPHLASRSPALPWTQRPPGLSETLARPLHLEATTPPSHHASMGTHGWVNFLHDPFMSGMDTEGVHNGPSTSRTLSIEFVLRKGDQTVGSGLTLSPLTTSCRPGTRITKHGTLHTHTHTQFLGAWFYLDLGNFSEGSHRRLLPLEARYQRF